MLTYYLNLDSFDYEQQMLYLEALGNLQLGNVAEYLDPIIKADYVQNTDIRFLAMWATMPTAHTRPEKVCVSTFSLIFMNISINIFRFSKRTGQYFIQKNHRYNCE